MPTLDDNLRQTEDKLERLYILAGFETFCVPTAGVGGSGQGGESLAIPFQTDLGELSRKQLDLDLV